MTIRTLLRARNLAVVRATDGTYRVAGGSVYKIWFSEIESRWLCECRAGRAESLCAHRAAIIMACERENTVDTAEKREAHG